MDRTFGAADIEQLLHELARRLAGTGAAACIRVAGGAAIALMDSNRRATQDIDAVLLPPGPVQAIAGRSLASRSCPRTGSTTRLGPTFPLSGSRTGTSSSAKAASSCRSALHNCCSR